MDRVAIEICFRLSAIEYVVQSILLEFTKLSSNDLIDRQVTDNLRQIVECLLQTRGCINHKFRGVKPWSAATDIGGRPMTARYESRLAVSGGDVVDDIDLPYTADVSDALTYALDTTGGGSAPTANLAGHDEAEDDDHDDAYDTKDNVLQSTALPWDKSANTSGIKIADIADTEIKVECIVDNDSDSKTYTDWILGGNPFLVKEEPKGGGGGEKDAPRRRRGAADEGEKKFKCDKCEAAFVKEEYLRQHETLFVHDKYRCEMCGQTFSWKKTFDGHMQIHSDKALKEEVTESSDVKELATVLKEDAVGVGRDFSGEPVAKEEAEAADDTVADTEVDNDAFYDDHDDDEVDDAKDDADFFPDNQDDNDTTTGDVPKKECDICGKMVKETTYSIHRKIHSGEKPYSCNICGKSFLRRNNMRDHKLRHGPRTRITCQTCGKGFLNQITLDKHLLRGACEKVLSKKSEMEMQALDPTFKAKKRKSAPYKNPMIECEICGKMMHRTNLYKHKRTHTGEKPYQCTVCEKSFITQFNLNSHMVSHGPREKTLCVTCGIGFLSQKALKNHTCDRTRSREATISCKICGKLVKHEGGLRMHMKVHSEERPYTCEVCGDSFRRPYEVNIHKMRHHEQPKCDICASSFTSISALNRHQQVVHSDDRPYSCDVCGKAYKEKQTLLKHKVIHNKDEHVKCEVCTKSFFFLNDLKKHYHKVHKLDIEVK